MKLGTERLDCHCGNVTREYWNDMEAVVGRRRKAGDRGNSFNFVPIFTLPTRLKARVYDDEMRMHYNAMTHTFLNS